MAKMITSQLEKEKVLLDPKWDGSGLAHSRDGPDSPFRTLGRRSRSDAGEKKRKQKIKTRFVSPTKENVFFDFLSPLIPPHRAAHQI